MIQLILHLIGDYVTQSDWMAQNKTKRSWPALCHAVVYSLPFLLLQPSIAAFSVILGTHFLIDRFRLARFLVWGKNRLFFFGRRKRPSYGISGAYGCWDYTDDFKRMSWENCKETGYPKDSPAWLSVWLLIAADNTLHLAINFAALSWL